MHELYHSGKWWDNDLTADANGLPAFRAANRFFDGSNEHVFYESSSLGHLNDHVHELYYNGKWWDNDLTADTDGPPAYWVSLTGFSEQGIHRLFYVSNSDYHVRELYYNGNWWGNDLTADTHGPSGQSTQLTSLVFGGSNEHVFYMSDGDYHVRELYYNGNWWGNDLTVDTNGPAAIPAAVTSFATP